ncbi:acyltransferase family protein [Flavobacterium tegetincola]|uniref:acyltransferase family protein n=1 Tax=Flavobacterium tegetincola TaxID=150172 RepID=UPI00146B3A82|nr:acyltransferase [Flavobacterium tegetincola]
MDEYTSQKIKISSFLLMIMVVFLHSYNLDMKQGNALIFVEKDFNWLIQNFVSNGITRIAVPLFFLISGFLFVRSSTFTLEDYKVKIAKRLKTLVIPYLFWTLFGLLMYFIMQSIPQSQGFFTNKLIKDYNLAEWLNAIFVQPIPYQLWFLKDLIVMVFISPLIVLAVKKLKMLYLSMIFIFWILSQDAIFLTSEALLFFSTGIYLSLFRPKSIEVKSDKNCLMISIWILILSLKTFLPLFIVNVFLESILLKVSILVGIVAFWWFLDGSIIRLGRNKVFISIMTFSFFIYLFHEPLLTIVKKVLFAALSINSLTSLIVFLVAPVITILICVFVGFIFKRSMNLIYSVATGNR